jgi:hypothetical protein
VSFGFEQHHGIILVKAILRGPSRDGFLLLALDTGATKTVISESVLKRLVIRSKPTRSG